MAAIASKIMELAQALEADEDKFVSGNKAAGSRARKTLQEIKRIAQEGRKDIQKAKNDEAAAD